MLRSNFLRVLLEALAFALLLAATRLLPESLENLRVDWWLVAFAPIIYAVARFAMLTRANRRQGASVAKGA